MFFVLEPDKATIDALPDPEKVYQLYPVVDNFKDPFPLPDKGSQVADLLRTGFDYGVGFSIGKNEHTSWNLMDNAIDQFKQVIVLWSNSPLNRNGVSTSRLDNPRYFYYSARGPVAINDTDEDGVVRVTALQKLPKASPFDVDEVYAPVGTSYLAYWATKVTSKMTKYDILF